MGVIVMRILLDLTKIAKKYGQNELVITQKDDDELVHIPLKRDIYIPLKCYISYDPDEHKVYVSHRLIAKGNYWLTQLRDDYKNNRIDLDEYRYTRI